MDPNHLLRMRTTPTRQGNDGWQENRYGTISPASAPADMIRMSFDQIYRATPVNPLLAQQLRRQQQQQQQQQQHQSPLVYPVMPSPLPINPIGHHQSPYVPPSVSNNSAPLGGIPPIYLSPSTTAPATMSYPNSSYVTVQQQQTQQPPNGSNNTSAVQMKETPQRIITPLSSSKISTISPEKSMSAQKPSPRVPPVQPVNLNQDVMPPPPPIVIGGSRTKRGASSTVDSLLAMRAAAIPISASHTTHSTNTYGSVSLSVSPMAPPSSSSIRSNNVPILAANIQKPTSYVISASSDKDSIHNSSNGAKRSRKSFPDYQPLVQAKVELLPPQKTITRSGRVCKPVSRIIKEMDNPASTTSYSAIRRLSFTNQPDISKEDIQSSAISLPFEEADIVPEKDTIQSLSSKKQTELDEEYVRNLAPVGSKASKTKKRTIVDSKKDSKDISVGEKLRALMAEADGDESLEATTVTVKTVPSTSYVIKDKPQKKDKPWLPTEVVALYAIYNKTDVTLPNFWQIISEKLKQEKNVLRSEEECKEKWFAALVDMNKRQEKMIQKKKQTQVDQALLKLQTINEQTAIMLGTKAAPIVSQSMGNKPTAKGNKKIASVKHAKANSNSSDDIGIAAENNEDVVDDDGNKRENSSDNEDSGTIIKVKRPRLGKTDMKVLAEHSSKALREDDAFESEVFRKQLQQHQEQRKTSAVARFLQQQAMRRSPFATSPTFAKKVPSPAVALAGDTPTARRLSAVLSDVVSPSTGNRERPLQGDSSLVSSVIMSPSTDPETANNSNSINILSVRRKSNMSLSQQQSPAVLGTTTTAITTSNTTPASSSVKIPIQQSTINNIQEEFSPLKTPTTTHVQPLRYRVTAMDQMGNKNNNKRKINVFDEAEENNEDEDLFNSRVVQKIKRVRPQPQLLFARSHQVLGASGNTKKKAKKIATKELSSVEEISKQYNQEMRRIQVSSDEEEEDEINSDDDF